MSTIRDTMKAGVLTLLSCAGLFCRSVCPARGAESPEPPGPITVLAATSLTDVLRDIASAYQKRGGGVVRFGFGASGTLARQIKEGAPADAFISADDARVDMLEHAGLLEFGARRVVFTNRLVIVTRAQSGVVQITPDQLSDSVIRRIAIGDPATVPAGSYAQSFLRRIGLWERLQSKFVATESVRAALAAVESGNADVAFVYSTDALGSKRVRIVYAVPENEQPRVLYPGVVLRRAGDKAAAAAFLDFLSTAEAREIAKRHGFLDGTPVTIGSAP